MENKISKLLAIIVCCLCFNNLYAAKIPQELQRQCAEYVAVRYTHTYIMSLEGKDKGVPSYIERFENADKWDIEQCHDSINNYIDWLRTNDFDKTSQQLTECIMNRHNVDVDSLLIISTEMFNNVCKIVRNQLKNDIVSYIDKDSCSNSNADSNKAKPEFEEGRYVSSIKKDKAINDYLLWGICVLSLINLGLIILLFRKTSRENIIATILNSHRIQEKLLDRKEAFRAPINNPQQDTRLSRLEQSVMSFTNELESLKKSLNNQPKEQHFSESKPSVLAQNISTIGKTVFTKNYGGGLLRECDETKAQYKIYVSNEGVSEFEFSGRLDQAKDAPDATFDGVCHLQGVGIENAKSYKTVVRGKVSRTENGWQVVEKTIIIIY